MLRWITVAACVLQGGYMAVDGVRGLVVGSYITPRSGAHAGQLGSWARLLSAVGVAPEATGTKAAFVVLGVATGAGWAWPTGLVLAVGTLWYLVPGTVLSIVVLLLLASPPVRRALGQG